MEKEQVTVVFGATGSVGAGVCRELARAGHTVVAHYFHNQKKAQQLVDEITALGGKAEAIQADVRELTQVEELVRRVSETHPVIHTAVNLIHRDDYEPKEVSDMEWEDWQCHLEAMKVHFNICKALIPVMKRQQYGRIVYILQGVCGLQCGKGRFECVFQDAGRRGGEGSHHGEYCGAGKGGPDGFRRHRSVPGGRGEQMPAWSLYHARRHCGCDWVLCLPGGGECDRTDDLCFGRRNYAHALRKGYV